MYVKSLNYGPMVGSDSTLPAIIDATRVDYSPLRLRLDWLTYIPGRQTLNQKQSSVSFIVPNPIVVFSPLLSFIPLHGFFPTISGESAPSKATQRSPFFPSTKYSFLVIDWWVWSDSEHAFFFLFNFFRSQQETCGRFLGWIGGW